MRLIDYENYKDYGTEHFLQVLQFYPHFALFDFTLQWDDYNGDEIFPRIMLSIGNRSLCGLSIRWKRFYFSVDVIDTDPRNLEWYRDQNRSYSKYKLIKEND